MTDHRIASTHTGSLPRPDDLIQLMWAVGDGIPVDREALESRIASSITEIVRRQVDAGVSVVNDGEMSKPSYATYVKDRLSGFGGESVQDYHFQDLVDFPRSARGGARQPRSPQAVGSSMHRADRGSRSRGRAPRHGRGRPSGA